jgi:hypothetical protein
LSSSPLSSGAESPPASFRLPDPSVSGALSPLAGSDGLSRPSLWHACRADFGLPRFWFLGLDLGSLLQSPRHDDCPLSVDDRSWQVPEHGNTRLPFTRGTLAVPGDWLFEKSRAFHRPLERSRGRHGSRLGDPSPRNGLGFLRALCLPFFRTIPLNSATIVNCSECRGTRFSRRLGGTFDGAGDLTRD